METHPDSPSAGVQPAAPRKPRRLLRFFLILVVLVVLIAGGAVYLQSSHALLHVYLPFAAKSLGTELTASGGDLGYDGSLVLRDVRLLGNDGQPAFEAPLLRLKLALGSLRGEGGPVVNEVFLESPVVHLYVDEKGRSNFEFGAEKPDKDKDEDKDKAAEPLPQFTLDTLAVNNLTLDYGDASGLAAELQGVTLKASNFAPGSEGKFDLDLKGAMHRPEEKLEYQLALTSAGTFAQSADRRDIGWDGKLDATLTGPADVTIAATSKGKADVAGKIEQSFDVQAQSAGASVGEFEGQMLWDPAQGKRDVNLTIDSISREFLNPFLAAAAPMQLHGGKLNGHVKLAGIGNDLDFDADFRASDVSFKLGDQPNPTEPMTIHTLKNGSFNLDTRMLELRETKLTLDQGGAQRVASSLSSPLKLSLEGGPTALDAAAANLTLQLNQLSIEALQPWLVMQGVDPEELPKGMLDGDLKIQVGKLGQSLTVTGTLAGSNLRGPRLGNAGLDLSNTIDLSLENMQSFTFGKTSIALASGGEQLAMLDFDGNVDIKALSGEVRLALNSPRPMALAGKLGWIPEETAGAYGTPTLSANQTLSIQPGATLIASKGSSLLTGISIPVRDGARTDLTARSETDLTFDLKQQTIKIAGLKTQFEQAKAAAGTIALHGEWPMVAAGRTGNLALKIDGFDLSPWLIMTRAVAARELPPIPLQADEKLELQADGRIRLTGEIKLGLAALQTAQGNAEAMNLALKHDVQQLGEQIEQIALQFSSSGAAPTDVASLQGSGSLKTGGRFDFTGSVERLRADPYMLWMERLNDSGAADASKAPPPATTEPAIDGEPATPSVPTIQGDLAIKDFAYQQITLKDAQVKARSEAGAMVFDIERGKLCDGDVSGQVEVDTAHAKPRYAWNMNVAGAEIAPIMATVDPASKRKIVGKATIASQGAAEGSGEELMRKLQSSTTFKVADGQFSQSVILNALADYTRIESFRNIQFHNFDGGVKIADNAVNIEKFEMVGALHRLVMNGTYNFDGSYDVRISPAVGSSLADKLGSNKYVNKVIGGGVSGFVPLLVDLDRVRQKSGGVDSGADCGSPWVSADLDISKGFGDLGSNFYGAFCCRGRVVGPKMPWESFLDSLGPTGPLRWVQLCGSR